MSTLNAISKCFASQICTAANKNPKNIEILYNLAYNLSIILNLTIQIELSEISIGGENLLNYEIEYRIIFADTDAMGVVYHANYLKWFEAVRNEFLRSISYPYIILDDMGIWFPVIEAHLNYKAPAKYDDVIVIRTKIAELKAASIKMEYEILNKESGQLLVTGYTRSGITDHDLKPLNIRKKFQNFYVALENAAN